MLLRFSKFEHFLKYLVHFIGFKLSVAGRNENPLVIGRIRSRVALGLYFLSAPDVDRNCSDSQSAIILVGNRTGFQNYLERSKLSPND